MELKYTLNEGFKSLDRIRLMMEYDLKKTLNENLNEITYNSTQSINPNSYYESDGKSDYKLINSDGAKISSSAKSEIRYFAKDVFSEKKPNEWPQTVNSNQMFKITSGFKETPFPHQGSPIYPIGKSPKSILPSDERTRFEYLEKIRKQAGSENMLSRKEWNKPEIRKEWESLKQKLEGSFPPSGNLDGTEKPKPPQIVGQYIKKPGTNNRVRWEYVRYEEKEPVVYNFEDLERGGDEYRKHYEQYKKDLKKWDFDNSVHDFFTILQVGSLLIPVVGPAISAGLGVGEAALFYQEGDEFMAGLMLIFSVIPGAGKLVPEFMSLNKASKTRISKFIRSGSKTTKITPKEKEVVKKLVQQQSKLKLFGGLAKLFIRFRTMIHKMNPFTFVRFANIMMKKYPPLKSILGEGMMFGGVFLGWGQIYKKIEETKNKEEQKKLEAQIKQKQMQIAKQLENPTDQQALALEGVNSEKLEKDMCAAFPEYC